MQVAVAVGDIVNADADVVVVSANTDLDFEGAAARALQRVCGDALAQELEARRSPSLGVGQVVWTTAGVHPRIKAVIWAVVRDYRGGAVHDDQVDDAGAVAAAARTLWRELLVRTKQQAAAPLAATPPGVRVALVPVGAVEIGAASSVRVFARALAQEQPLHAQLASVTFMTTRAKDIPAMRAAADRVFPSDDVFDERTTPGAAEGGPALPSRPRPLKPSGR